MPRTTTKGPTVAKLLPSLTLRMKLNELMLRASCFQPVWRFKPGHRALPSVPRDDDPWECYLFHDIGGTVGCVGTGDGDTIDESVEAALRSFERKIPKPDLKWKLHVAEQAIEALAETIRGIR